MNFNYGFIKKDPKQPVMAESLRHIKIQQPDIEAFIDNENDFLAITRARISAQVADISDKAIYQAIIDYATKAGLTDVYLIDEKFIRDAIVTKVTKDVEVEALRIKIENLEEELAHRDKQNEELFKEVKRLESEEVHKMAAQSALREIKHKCDKLEKQNDKLLKENDKYDLVIHTIEQLFGCAFDI